MKPSEKISTRDERGGDVLSSINPSFPDKPEPDADNNMVSMAQFRCPSSGRPHLVFLLLSSLRTLSTSSPLQITLSNTALPTDNFGELLKTGEIDVFSNLERDGYVYFFVSDWGCVRQVSCCNSSLPWPDDYCWTCCPTQRAVAYQYNHTIQGYRTRDFSNWENLGVLIGVDDRAPGAVFVPRVVFNPTTSQYVMWFENYSGSQAPVGGQYSVAVSSHPDRGWRTIIDRPHSAQFACGTSQGDFDLFVDPAVPTVAYIINTYYDHFCVEELDASFTGGTGKTTNVTAMDPTIPGHPPGSEAPSVFKRAGWWYLTYASGCCGCVGGGVTWLHRAPHPLGPWEQNGTLLTPAGPVTRAQQRAVFRVPSPASVSAATVSTPTTTITATTTTTTTTASAQQWTYIHVGNQWGSDITPQQRLPQGGVEGTCEDHSLLYFWVLEFDAQGSIVPRTTFEESVSFEMAPAPVLACASVVPPPQQCDERPSALTTDIGEGGKGQAWTVYADLTDAEAVFAAQAVVANLSGACPVGSIAPVLGDTHSPAFAAATARFIAVGRPATNAALRRKAAAWNVSAAPSIAGRAEAYTLAVALKKKKKKKKKKTTAPTLEAIRQPFNMANSGHTTAKGHAATAAAAAEGAIFLLGEDAAGAYYAVQTLLQLSRTTTCRLPELRVVDYPDLQLRGGEVEGSFTPQYAGNQTAWWHAVADKMASLKLNWVLYDVQLGLSHNWSTGEWAAPAPETTQAHLARKRYFEQRHIHVCLLIGAKWDPRTLEAKAVSHEPFVFANGSDVASAVTPSATGKPLNGDFEIVHNVTRPDGSVEVMPLGWRFEKGSHEWSGIPCGLDEEHSFTGKRSVKCDIQRFPDPDPFVPPPHAHDDRNWGRHTPQRQRQRQRRFGMENPGFNYSGPLASQLFPIEGGALYSLEYSASWRGNWSGAFTAAVIMLQYKTKAEASAAAGENPTTPTWPFAQSFLPCQGGDARQCHGATAIPQLPQWGTYHKSLITMPEARFMRLVTLVPGWGAGQYWVDGFKLTRIDAELRNVVYWPSRPGNDSGVVLVDAETGRLLRRGTDYDIIPPPPTATYSVIGNLTALEPLQIRRLKPSLSRVNASFNVLPGNEGNIVGGRDVSCFVDPAYESLAGHAIDWVLATFDPVEYLVADGFDEQMGMGRDARTLRSGLSNAAIVARAINFLHAAVASGSNQTRLTLWADMLNPDHNGGANYSFLNGAGRPQPYWPAIHHIPDDVLLLSWIYDTSPYAAKLIRDAPALFQNASKPWVGSGWTEAANVDLWAKALRESQTRYGPRSTARGLIDTNWGGGKFETGLEPVARRGWNLRSSSVPSS